MHEDKFTDVVAEAFLTGFVLQEIVRAGGLPKSATRNVHIQIAKLKRMTVGRKPILTAAGTTKADRKRLGKESAAITKQLKLVRNLTWEAFGQLHSRLDPSSTKRKRAEQRKPYERTRALAVKDIIRQVKALASGQDSQRSLTDESKSNL